MNVQPSLLTLCERAPQSTHAENLRRVKTNIAPAILAFLKRKGVGVQFSMVELTEAVRLIHPSIAPDSPGRILRDLNQRGEIGYELVSRSQSLYRVTFIQDEFQEAA